MSITAQQLEKSISEQVGKIVVGKEKQIRLIVAAILAQGHVLLDDLPGVGKTTLVKCLSKALGCESKRIQFTPDMLPSDIIGMNIFDRNTGEFKRLEGPVMTNILLADELNRAIPRTQSALLEAMEERQVTIDGAASKLPSPFCVLATQNPVESESTFHLPAAQMDRFLMCLSLGYPTMEEEMRMLNVVGKDIPFDEVETVTGPEEINGLSESIMDNVSISDDVAKYIVSIVSSSRNDPSLKLGASPRATRALYRVSKCLAAINGRNFVTPDDVKELIKPVLAHRLMISSRAAIEGKTVEDVLNDIVNSTEVLPVTKELFNE